MLIICLTMSVLFSVSWSFTVYCRTVCILSDLELVQFSDFLQCYYFYLRLVCRHIYLCSFSFRHDGVVPQKCPAVPASRWSPRTEVECSSTFSIKLHTGNRTTTLEREVHKDDGSSVEVRVMLNWTRGH